MIGDIGTFAGLTTNAATQVLDRQRAPIAGLHAVGNDMASIMGGNYPGAGITLGPALTFGYIAGLALAGAEEGMRQDTLDSANEIQHSPVHQAH
ncbi:hypothetical protein R75461_07824 [Paraburkholderia nemoris]|nr:hypothetical protein R75461_07824 [Paraburkholderia nemoris]